MGNPSTPIFENAIRELARLGQSVWYSGMRLSELTGGTVSDRINIDDIKGISSDLELTLKVVSGTEEYDDAIRHLARLRKTSREIFDNILVKDIQIAADLLWPVYCRTAGRDGYVAFDISPYAYDTAEEMIKESKRLIQRVDKENVMVKIPATMYGIPVVEQLIGEGINVKVTHVYNVNIYRQVAESYIYGLEKLSRRVSDLGNIKSMAGLALSTIDAHTESRLRRKGSHKQDADVYSRLSGKVAVAMARMCYKEYQDFYSSEKWKFLKSKGANPQQLIWTHTTVPSPSLDHTFYVRELAGPDTSISLSDSTLSAFRNEKVEDGGDKLTRIQESTDCLEVLTRAGIPYSQIGDSLLIEHVESAIETFDRLLSAIDQKREFYSSGGDSMPKNFTYSLGELETKVTAAIEDARQKQTVKRIWDCDNTLWSGSDEDKWLGWLNVTEQQLAQKGVFAGLASEIKEAGFSHALLLGMGGSSLCPEVIKKTFGSLPGCPELFVLDSTVPAQVKDFENKVDLAKTVFIVASKSGSTTEPNMFLDYFYARAKEVVGEKVGSHFIAITDPGSDLEKRAGQLNFRHVFYGVPSIGGRYSALSNFGMIPAAAMGVDVSRFLANADRMVKSCGQGADPANNTGFVLGAIMGTLALAGRDKVTIVTSPAIGDLGAWLEQLLAESTGKEGRGLIPVDAEALGPPDVYGDDRLFAYIRLKSAPDADQDRKIDALEKGGQPVVRIEMNDVMELGAEFFRWEFATAVAGSILKINAFNQPNVQESKDYTKKFLEDVSAGGKLPDDVLILEADGFKLYSDEANKKELQATVKSASLQSYLAAHLIRLKPGDYFAITAYINHTDANTARLQAIREFVRDNDTVATTVGFGPRFLHSTGQLHKGGPNSGVFLQLTCDDEPDLDIPGEPYSFGTLKQAQSLGDTLALSKRQRRILRVHLGTDVEKNLDRLVLAVKEAVSSSQT